MSRRYRAAPSQPSQPSSLHSTAVWRAVVAPHTMARDDEREERDRERGDRKEKKETQGAGLGPGRRAGDFTRGR